MRLQKASDGISLKTVGVTLLGRTVNALESERERWNAIEGVTPIASLENFISIALAEWLRDQEFEWRKSLERKLYMTSSEINAALESLKLSEVGAA